MNGMVVDPLAKLSCRSRRMASGSCAATSRVNGGVFVEENLEGDGVDAAKKYSPGLSEGDSEG